jgi:hypothetical protein
MSLVHDKLRLNPRPSTFKLEKNIDTMVPIEYAGHRPRRLHTLKDVLYGLDCIQQDQSFFSLRKNSIVFSLSLDVKSINNSWHYSRFATSDFFILTTYYIVSHSNFQSLTSYKNRWSGLRRHQTFPSISCL